jgi:hypothetical protein
MKSFLRIALITICALTAGAAKYHDARIEMSNGKILDGKLCLMGRRPVTIIPLGSKYQRKILLPDIVSITQVTEQRSMNRPWAYKESGKVDKVYFDGSYPFYNFATDLLLTNGQSVRGHIISIPFRFKGKGPSKLFLTRQIKGKVGETFDDVVYPVKIVFTGRKGIALEPIKGTVAGYGKLLAVTALDNRREVVCFANIKGDSFEFTKLLPGTYDIFVLTDQYALSGMSGDGPENTANGEKLPPDALDGLFSKSVGCWKLTAIRNSPKRWFTSAVLIFTTRTNIPQEVLSGIWTYGAGIWRKKSGRLTAVILCCVTNSVAVRKIVSFCKCLSLELPSRAR